MLELQKLLKNVWAFLIQVVGLISSFFMASHYCPQFNRYRTRFYNNYYEKLVVPSWNAMRFWLARAGVFCPVVHRAMRKLCLQGGL
ncbi:hypothetical protein UB47_05730 [Pseudomonas sp. 5]|nr:hypothetical protein UB47_05730 [Pseudomonas sp. 5]